MFIYNNWERFCEKVSGEFNCIRIDEILDQSKNSRWVAIKHDVEANVEKALGIAIIENRHGIKATYFIQSYLLLDNLDVLLEIAKLGHEVTYHYDVLDSNLGDMDKALAEFNATLNEFRKNGFAIKTVCPHGNPIVERNGWSSNKDFFRSPIVTKAFPEIFDVVVYGNKFIKGGFSYISDAGYGWNIVANIQDNDIENKGDILLSNLNEVTSHLKKTQHTIISSHPHRWSKTYAQALVRVVFFKLLRVIVRQLTKIVFFRRIVSKFYHLAKKV